MLTSTAPGTTTFTDTTAVNGTRYYYAVAAIDADGNQSDPSATVDATPADTTAPSAVQGFAAVAGDTVVNLHWTPSTEADFQEYRLYRSTTSPVALTAANLIETTAAAAYSDTDRVNGTELFYVVTAVDGAGNESVASTEKSATPTPAPDVTAPATPAGVTATAGNNLVTLAWTANTEGDVAGYKVYRSATAGGTRTLLTTTPVSTAGYVDATAANTLTYYYTVSAVDLVGNESAQSQEVSATPADTTARPSRPA